jgi:hypothetical protein
MEVLKGKFGLGLFMVKPTTPASDKMISESKLRSHIVERHIDSKLFKLNKSGYLNGHTPITSVMYFLSILTAYIFGYKYITFSNERSSSEGNVKYLGEEVNHQYSKTFEFESDFREYNSKYLSNIGLFSLLKPLYQIQITKLFSGFKEYFPIIRSCNVGQQQGIWCGACSKCLSTYILLLPFLGIEKTKTIFGRDLLENRKLLELLNKLIDENKTKPFQCLGTRVETKIALNMSLKLYDNKDLPALLHYFVKSKHYNKNFLLKKEKEYLKSWGENNLPTPFVRLLKQRI